MGTIRRSANLKAGLIVFLANAPVFVAPAARMYESMT